MALLRLYTTTGNQDAYDLAHFLEERGNPSGVNGRHFYGVAAQGRGDVPWKRFLSEGQAILVFAGSRANY